MVLVLAVLLVCASMLGIYAILRAEERYLFERPSPDSTRRQP